MFGGTEDIGVAGASVLKDKGLRIER